MAPFNSRKKNISKWPYDAFLPELNIKIFVKLGKRVYKEPLQLQSGVFRIVNKQQKKLVFIFVLVMWLLCSVYGLAYSVMLSWCKVCYLALPFWQKDHWSAKGTSYKNLVGRVVSLPHVWVCWTLASRRYVTCQQWDQDMAFRKRHSGPSCLQVYPALHSSWVSVSLGNTTAGSILHSLCDHLNVNRNGS